MNATETNPIPVSSATDAVCFHCGEDLPSKPWTSQINGEAQPMCCPGCKAVADLICASGMGDFYRKRTHFAETPQAANLDDDFSSYELSIAKRRNTQESDDATEQTDLLILGMTCPACSWLVERRVGHQEGVLAAKVNLNESRLNLQLSADANIPKIMRSIADLGYQVQPFQVSARTKALAEEHRILLKRVAVAGLGMMQVGMFAIALHAGNIYGMESQYEHLMRWVSLPVALFVTYYSAAGFFKSAWQHLKHGALIMDLPIALALGLALSASVYATLTGGGEVYFDSVVMFTFFLLVARFTEQRGRFKNSLTLQTLQDAMPHTATVIRHDGITKVAISEITLGTSIRLFKGDRVPLDAQATSGICDVDESAFTGESITRSVEVGDTVYAGTVIAHGTCDALVTALPGSTRLDALERAILYAETTKPRIALMADRIAGVFVAIILTIAAATAVYWYQNEPAEALWIALAVLVVSCPCALGLATPAALSNAAQTLRRRGIIARGESTIETLAKIDTVIFDKTGTLTDGAFDCVEIQSSSRDSEQDLYYLACRLQEYSNHPITSAFEWPPGRPYRPVVEHLELEQALKHTHSERPVSVSGRGILIKLTNSEYRLGNRGFIEELCGTQPWPESQLHWLGLANDSGVLAFFGVRDRARIDASVVVDFFKSQGKHVHLLTGDSSPQATLLAHSLKIEHVCSGATPEGKLAYVEKLQARGAKTLMIGDGINDAAVLAQADVGIAVAQASDMAKAEADMVILSNQLNALCKTYSLATRTKRIIIENLGWALCYNAVAIPFAAAGHVPPWLAALGMSFSSIVVVLNSLRINKIT